MKSRASLMLMEQLIMVLVFALAASICLGVFLEAGEISADTARRDGAVLLAQNAAEALKASGGDVEAARALSEGSGFTLEIQRISTDIPGLGQAELQVLHEGQLLFSLHTGWQEVGG